MNIESRLFLTAFFLLAAAACGGGAQAVPDGVDDAGDHAGDDADAAVSSDAHRDTGRGDEPDAAPAPPFPLPLFRVGPRTTFGGGVISGPIAGTISVPSTVRGFDSFAGYRVFGKGGGADGTAVTIGTPTKVGDAWVATLSARVALASSDPVGARELFTAVSPDGSVVLTTVLDGKNELHFSVTEAARQALALAGVRASTAVSVGIYQSGARAGDDPAIDAHVPTVAERMTALLASSGATGTNGAGMALPGTPVFEAIDAGIGRAAAPTIHAPRSAAHLGIADLAEGSGQAAFFLNGSPLPHLPLDGASRFSFFFYGMRPGPLYLRQRLASGGQSHASAVFEVPDGAATPAVNAPTLVLKEEAARACGGEAGSWIVFVSSGTELAVGFAALPVETTGGCVALARAKIPAGVALLTTMQVTADLRLSAPSEVVFP